jgi:hypothetical protein
MLARQLLPLEPLQALIHLILITLCILELLVQKLGYINEQSTNKSRTFSSFPQVDLILLAVTPCAPFLQTLVSVVLLSFPLVCLFWTFLVNGTL